MSTPEVKKIVRAYAKTLHTHNVPFQSMYIFGSQVKGASKRWSDIDVLVVTNKFPGGYFAYKGKLWGLTTLVDTRIEPHACTVKEFKNAETMVAAETKKTGIKII